MDYRVIVTKRSIYNILPWAIIYFLLPVCVFFDFKYDLNILKWVLLAFAIYTIPSIYFVLVFVKEKIIVSSEGIIHILSTKKKLVYRWGDVKKGISG